MVAAVVSVVLLTNGLAAGVLTGTLLGGWPLLSSLPPDRYVQAHAFFSTRYDPFMPICLAATAIGDLVLLVAVPAAGPRGLYAAGAVLTLASITISLVVNAPVNRWMRTLDPDNLPADFAQWDPRPRWAAWNRARTTLTVLALFVNCAAIALLMEAGRS
ncbi:hypothetical protein ALI144C_31400 [Actinosynnema sp. ALI-1.44]|uniref:DUF1772 domain-containing protein n=1 Tax=Actinosynnema sp. ALI-1.44 TaxID=1933779 RepID=UPI00097BE3B3|nr:DUF1772 domain-containing protein [Actinosynnema sp. ALI-1.44]ONI77911.1 hypothetical protein ALI144C_31400 [Actinosynnema sp. ALI-1.44]